MHVASRRVDRVRIAVCPVGRAHSYSAVRSAHDRSMRDARGGLALMGAKWVTIRMTWTTRAIGNSSHARGGWPWGPARSDARRQTTDGRTNGRTDDDGVDDDGVDDDARACEANARGRARRDDARGERGAKERRG